VAQLHDRYDDDDDDDVIGTKEARKMAIVSWKLVDKNYETVKQ
jgi:hypothetical protein